MTDCRLQSVGADVRRRGTSSVLIAGVVLLLASAFSACQLSDATAQSDETKSSRPAPGLDEVPTFDLGLSVDEAYAAIPHRRTVIQPAGSDIPQAEKGYLEVAFRLIDQAILLRVATQRNFLRGDTDDPSAIRRMDQLIDFLQGVDPPSNLKTYHKRIEQALSDQRAFFAEWQAQGAEFEYASPGRLSSHPKVSSSSRALKEAYGILMRSYPQDSKHNKEAFFDYHCALDFL